MTIAVGHEWTWFVKELKHHKLSERRFAKLCGITMGAVEHWGKKDRVPAWVAMVFYYIAHLEPADRREMLNATYLREAKPWHQAQGVYMLAKANLQRWIMEQDHYNFAWKAKAKDDPESARISMELQDQWRERFWKHYHRLASHPDGGRFMPRLDAILSRHNIPVSPAPGDEPPPLSA